MQLYMTSEADALKTTTFTMSLHHASQHAAVTLSDCTYEEKGLVVEMHLHSQTLALPQVTSLALHFFLFLFFNQISQHFTREARW